MTQEPAREQVNSLFQRDQRKNEFLATLAHELRNPLAPIKSGLQLLEMMNLDKEAEVVRSMMARQVDQIIHLVDDLLDISRICCGKILLDKQVCRIKAVVEAAVEESSILILENGMTLEVIDNSNSACVCGDLRRLIQVVCNLLNNAAKYGRPGGSIRLTIDVRSGFAVIRVLDNGIGIAANRLIDIFEMYSQIENMQGRGSTGLGVGLALVKTLVELHGGFVDAASDGPNCGSTLTIRLPLAIGQLQENASSKVIFDRTSLSVRVLVVDDLRAMRIITQQLLEKLGHEVQVAENGVVALEKLDSFQPDVVFADITMPVMGGHELVRRIRQRSNLDSVYLVALTGYGQSTDRKNALEAGFDRHLTKPIDFEILQSLLDELGMSRRLSLV